MTGVGDYRLPHVMAVGCVSWEKFFPLKDEDDDDPDEDQDGTACRGSPVDFVLDP